MRPLQNIARGGRNRSNLGSGEVTHYRPLSFRLRCAPHAGAAECPSCVSGFPERPPASQPSVQANARRSLAGALAGQAASFR